MGYRIRLINLKTKSVCWKSPPTSYVGTFSVMDPQIALIFAECVVESWGDSVVKVSAVDFLDDKEEDLGGILVAGKKFGVLVEGAEIY